MTLHIFNPEHDLALASDKATFTPPHAARQLGYDLGYIPALWASSGDAVLVENKEKAEREFAKVRSMISKYDVKTDDVFFVEPEELNELSINNIQPWGWDSALAYKLDKYGVSSELLPDNVKLLHIRDLSHRKTSAQLLSKLNKLDNTIGESFTCNCLEEVEDLLSKYTNIVIKAPWSSSGRGLRFGIGYLTDHQRGWIRNIITKQGVLMVEPYYNKVKDFGMEFSITNNGMAEYLGLSMFDTHNGAYTGNLLTTEATKQEMLSRYLDIQTIDNVRSMICKQLPVLLKGYEGPVGVDMMVLHDRMIHPCVEINLRRTMGHVALNISPRIDDIIKVMRIEMINSNYKLKIKQV